MTVYEYACKRGHKLKEDFPMGEAAEFVMCPQCGSMAKRVFGVAGIEFKGTGWARKDDKK